MVNCAIIGCNHKQGKHLGVRFFTVPTAITNQCAKTLDLSRRRRAEWIARINRVEITENTVRKHHKVCGKHFLQGHPSSLFDPTNPDWAPSQDLGYEITYDNQSIGQQPEEDPLSVIPKEFEHNKEAHAVPVEENEYKTEQQSVHLEEFDIKTEEHSIPVEQFEFKTEEHSVPFDHLMPMTSEVYEEITVDSKDWKVDLSNMSSEPSAKDVSVQTCPIVIYTEIQTSQDMIGASVQPSHSVIDAASETRLCCDEHNKLESERDALVQNVACLNARLSESMFEAESFHKYLVEKNESLAEKNLKIIELETKLKQLGLTSSCMDNSELGKIILSEDNFRTDDKKVSFYTGLPSFTQLMVLFNLVSGNVRDSTRYTLSKFQQFLMVIMWLRLGLEEQDLAYRFGLSQASVSRNLYRWLIPTASSLERFIVWPDRETLQTHTPLCFHQNWKNAAVVTIDCFEIFIGRPLYLRGGACSHDKNQNTVKFLIAITPQGTISFISKSFVSHTSDEHITENCGLLDKLLPGDIIIADHGCNIVDAGGILGARLAISDPTKSKPQLSLDDSVLTREIANVRNNIKQVIGLVRRKYKILSGILPVELSTKKPGEDLSPIDHVAHVCCALTNVCLSVAPLE